MDIVHFPQHSREFRRLRLHVILHRFFKARFGSDWRDNLDFHEDPDLQIPPPLVHHFHSPDPDGY